MFNTVLDNTVRIIVTGSRYFTDLARMRQEITALLNQHCADMGLVPYRDLTPENVIIVHGGARGADAAADAVAREMGFTVEVHPAEWDRYGKAAGPIRNKKMADLGGDYLLAVPGPNSRGTLHMMDCARNAGIPMVPVMCNWWYDYQK